MEEMGSENECRKEKDECIRKGGSIVILNQYRWETNEGFVRILVQLENR